ncbi:TetR/AcrR family transcriptional regulator [Aeromicrobium phragmitis]|uniref:TetR/AcrR family transcriptional regulator n=1 Tax=Aeromicrobium phragmitis TaxID=2478914 RepID=A0A3L8PLN4_9ACTN|nr:TetR family transcriptional regulator [Aeromicrobium phragmitis]RLV56134.1 TetR/AcrR family transcriptional regulator [Aeromicrobium phragmitis]
MTGARRRGRPRSGESVDRRAAILEAARRRFAARGFAGTTVRAIADDAGVDPSLVAHYFGNKQQLLVASLELPVDPISKLAGVVQDGVDGLGERLVRTFVTSWDPHREVIATMIRDAMAGNDTHSPITMVARSVLIATVTGVLDGPDRDVRADLIASQVIGLATLRYVVAVEPLASAPVDDVVRWYAPAIQAVADDSR